MIPSPYLIPLKHPEKAEPPQTIDRAGSTDRLSRLNRKNEAYAKSTNVTSQI